MPEFRPAPVPYPVFCDVAGAFVTTGGDADIDTAFDDAVEGAWVDFGRAEVVPSLACMDASSVQVLTEAPVPQAAALAVAMTRLRGGLCEPGVVWAVPLCRDSMFRRRRVVVRSEDPTVELGAMPGVLWAREAEVDAHILALLGEAGAAPDAEEVIEQVEVRRVRAWHKAVATSNPGRNVNEFVAVVAETGAVISAGHRTAGEARRAAMAVAKAGPVDGLEQFTVEIVNRPRRDTGAPLVSIVRARVKQRATLKVTLAAVKDPAKLKTAGWLFFGVVGQASAQSTAQGAAAAGEQAGASVPVEVAPSPEAAAS